MNICLNKMDLKEYFGFTSSHIINFINRFGV